MKTAFWKFMSCVGAAALGCAIVPGAAAQCGLPNQPIKPMSWHSLDQFTSNPLLRTVDDQSPAPIVGMWHVIFKAKTQNGEAIPVPGGVVIDNSVAVWHSDGTEVMNSSRSAQDGNFCLGVWKRTGDRTYFLNHIPWQGNVFDPTVPPGTIGMPQAGAQIIEKITLDPDGDAFTGTFILRAFDTSGNVYVSFTGNVSAHRITTATSFSSLL